MRHFLLALVAVLFTTSAFAGNALYFGIRHGFEGTRALGMGNAFTAVADDNTAIFYNPAGLRQLEKGESNWFLKADVDPDIQDFYKDIDDASKQTGSQTTAITNVLEKNYGKHFSARLPSLGWLWARPNWGLAVIPLDLSIDMAMHRSVGPAVNLVAIQDTTVAFTYNWNLYDSEKYGTVHLGVTSKAIYRLSVDQQVQAFEAADGKVFDEKDANEGFTVDADVGALWIGPWKTWNPTGALVIRNVGDYGYTSSFKLIGEGSGKPEKLHRRFDLGTSLVMPDWWVWSSRLAMDIRDIGHPNWNLRKGFHFGVEFLWKVFSWWKGGWRAGINQGYLTLGFTGEFGIFKLDLASYGEEIGVEGSNVENRRYMMTMSLDF